MPSGGIAGASRVALDAGGDDCDDRDVFERLRANCCVVHVRSGPHECDDVRGQVDFTAGKPVVMLGAFAGDDVVAFDVGLALAALVVDEVAHGAALTAGDGRGAEYAVRAEQLRDDESARAPDLGGPAGVEVLAGGDVRHQEGSIMANDGVRRLALTCPRRSR